MHLEHAWALFALAAVAAAALWLYRHAQQSRAAIAQVLRRQYDWTKTPPEGIRALRLHPVPAFVRAPVPVFPLRSVSHVHARETRHRKVG